MEMVEYVCMSKKVREEKMSEKMRRISDGNASIPINLIALQNRLNWLLFRGL